MPVTNLILHPNQELNNAMKETMSIRTLPYAFVLKVSQGCKIGNKEVEKGDIVRLYDYQAKTITNPRHTAYYDNDASNSNGERLGEAPDPLVHRIQIYHRERTFWTDCTKEPDMDYFHTFKFGLFDIQGVYSLEDFKIAHEI